MTIPAIAVFICMFIIYQAAEVAIRFYNNIPMFLGLMLLTITVGYFLTKKLLAKSIFVYDSNSLRNNSRNLLVGIVSGIATYLASFYISKVLLLEVSGRRPDVIELTKGLLIFTAGTFLPSLAEDLLTRGYLFAIWPRKYSPLAFVLFSSCIYVLNHTYTLSNGPPLIIYLFITGVSLAIPMLLTSSIWYTFGLHWTCNIIYRMSNDIYQSSQVPGKVVSSLAILCVVVACFIPINMLVISLSNKRFGCHNQTQIHNN